MNLYQTVQYILSVAKVQPNIGLAYEGDVYRLNELQDIQYPAIVVSQNTHGENGDFRSYSFFVFYVDRLLSDKSNRLEVQTIGLEVLSNIYKVLIESGFETEGDVRFHPFNERFDSECAGMYMEIALQSLESLCADGEMPYIPGGGGIEPSWFNPADYYTSAQTDERITEAITEISLDDYWTSAETQTAINNAVSSITYSGVTKEELNQAIAAETARTEQTYLKEHQSLDNYYTKSQTDSAITEAVADIDLSDYYTSGQTDSAIQTAVQGKVESTTITQIWTGSQAQYDAMSAHSVNILYIINS